MKRMLALGVATMGVVAGMVALPATAQAEPNKCIMLAERDHYPMYVHAGCGDGTGQFRVIATCQGEGDAYSVYGRWASPKMSESKAYCRGKDSLEDYRFDPR